MNAIARLNIWKTKKRGARPAGLERVCEIQVGSCPRDRRRRRRHYRLSGPGTAAITTIVDFAKRRVA